MSKYQYIDCRKGITPDIEEQIRQAWIQDDVLPKEFFNERLKEIAMVAVNEQGKLVTVSSCYKEKDPILGVYLYYLRGFVPSQFRSDHLVTEIIVVMKKLLNDEFVKNNKQELQTAIGTAVVLENESIRRNLITAVLPKTGSTFYGFNEKQEPCYVRYFDRCKIL